MSKNKIITMLLALNVFDLLATLYILHTGIGIEINPLLNLVYRLHPILFIAAKSILAGSGLLMLWLADIAHVHWAKTGLYWLTTIYTLLVIYQINGIISTL